VDRAVVLDFHPRLGGLVEKFERQLRRALEHPHETAFERAPKRLLLAVLIGAVRKRPLVHDSQAQETFGKFLGHHGGGNPKTPTE
jgi:hypothetical protein